MTTLFLRVLILVTILSACAQSAHQSGQYLFDRLVPKDLRQQVDPDVSFSDLRSSPSSYEGKVVMLNGVILGAKRARDRTEIEVLQIPSSSSFGPSENRSRSEGRFLAVQEGSGLDPAVVEEGNPVTVIGEVKESVVKSLDESQYAYPVLEIKQLVDWSKTMSSEYAGYGPHPYYGGYYGYYPYQYYPYWGPYRYAPYGLYRRGFGFSSPSPAPSPPPQGSIPPQFKKRGN
ncbi:MAG: Slp family lipoprotein [Nitrospiraceae bacterium]